jgi:hypothetical protein
MKKVEPIVQHDACDILQILHMVSYGWYLFESCFKEISMLIICHCYISLEIDVGLFNVLNRLLFRGNLKQW